ncbi:MAG: NEW3 domain-containing protein, partial [Actinopolymorphaceae bacterium]
DILRGEPTTAWQLDVFGHDPQLPGYLADAGLTGTAWARGPYHQWGPVQKNFGMARADASAMQFPSEFEWIAPSGRGVLTHYMPNHYSAGWWMDSAATLPEAEIAVYAMYRILKPVAATRHLMLPVGTDYAPPNKWVTAIHRSWNAKYVWPRFVCGTPRDFLDAVRTEMYATGRRPSPQTRDMNPIYTGKDVSYIDTKQAQRAAEIAVLDAEKLATLAALLGLGRYPDAALDKVWRQLAYGAHQDAITGSESDQVYIDLLAGWREAYDLATSCRDSALEALVTRIDTRTAGAGRAGNPNSRENLAGEGEGTPVVVVNTLGFDRSDLAQVANAPAGRLVDDTGTEVPAMRDRGTLVFRADEVPALGWRTYRLVPALAPERVPERVPDADHREPPATPAWIATGPPTHPIANERYRLRANPDRGGGLASVVDLATGRELLRGVGNELLLYDEYPTHPDFGEGPRHLVPRGPVVGSAETSGTVRREAGPLGERLVTTGTLDVLSYEQTVTLWRGVDRIDFRTRIIDHRGEDKLLRVRFPVDLPGALPMSGVAAAVVGRGYGLPDVDAAEAPWTLDNPAHTWFGLGSTARVSLVDPDGNRLGDRAVGVAEVVVGQVGAAASARELVVALARVGVTATTSGAQWARYGWLSVDSNLPDFRIVLGGPDENAVARELLARCDAKYTAEFDRQLAATGRVLLWIPPEQPLRAVWRPNADLRDVRALPALLTVGPVDSLVADLADAAIDAVGLDAPLEPLTDATVALLTYGLPGFSVDPAGALHLSLLRSCTGWPSGVWVDPPRRATPDGSAFQLQRWTHDFRYAMVAGDGDWRALSLPSRGQEYCTPLHARAVTRGAPRTVPRTVPRPERLPGRHSFVRIEPAREVLLSALKPTGNPIATGSAVGSDPGRGITLRLAESTGFGRRATIGGALALTDARRANLLERPHEPTELSLDLAGFEVATVVATPVDAAAPDGVVLGPSAERPQPEYARYWLHNRGPAPMGYLPVTVAVSPRSLHCSGGESLEVEVVLASQLRDAAHESAVRIRVPAGWSVDPLEQAYELPAGGHLRFAATVTPPPDVVEGTYFVCPQISYAGTPVEDVATVVVTREPERRAGSVVPIPAPRSEATPAQQLPESEPVPETVRVSDGAVEDGGRTGQIPSLEAETTSPATVELDDTTVRTMPARDTGLVVDVVEHELVVSPGARGSIAVTLTNLTRDEIRGEVQLVSPWGTWPAIPLSWQGFSLPARARTIVDFPVVVPADAEPGHAWAMAKVMWFGRCQYAPTVRFVIA